MSMEFRHINDISNLPRSALGRRFSQDVIDWLRMSSPHDDPPAPVARETFFVRELNFLDGIVNHEGLVFAMQRLLGEFVEFLRNQQFATRQVTWRLTHVDGSAQEIVIHTTRPETAPATLLAETRVRLESTRLPAAVETLRLACRHFVPLTTRQQRARQRSTGDSTGLDDAFTGQQHARLANATCHGFAPVGTWQTEAAQAMKTLNADTGDSPAIDEDCEVSTTDFAINTGANPDSKQRIRVTVKQENADYLPTRAHIATTTSATERARPLWLLREPARVHRNDAQLLWNGRLEIVDGPERIETDWWAQPVQRDYFVARHEAGTLCWIFHDHAHGEWFVQGVFG